MIIRHSSILHTNSSGIHIEKDFSSLSHEISIWQTFSISNGIKPTLEVNFAIGKCQWKPSFIWVWERSIAQIFPQPTLIVCDVVTDFITMTQIQKKSYAKTSRMSKRQTREDFVWFVNCCGRLCDRKQIYGGEFKDFWPESKKSTLQWRIIEDSVAFWFKNSWKCFLKIQFTCYASWGL